jgi:hypothetical protein
MILAPLFMEKSLKLTMKVCYTEKNILKLNGKIQNIWENNPPLKILAISIKIFLKIVKMAALRWNSSNINTLSGRFSGINAGFVTTVFRRYSEDARNSASVKPGTRACFSRNQLQNRKQDIL